MKIRLGDTTTPISARAHAVCADLRKQWPDRTEGLTDEEMGFLVRLAIACMPKEEWAETT